MNVIGYYLALTSLYALEGGNLDLYDISMKIADLDTLSTYLKSYPEFDIESFKKDRVNRVGDVGMFVTDNLRLYCLNGDGNADDEGVILTFTSKEKSSSEEDKTAKNLANVLFFIRKEGIPEDLVRSIINELNKQQFDQNRFVYIQDPREKETNE